MIKKNQVDDRFDIFSIEYQNGCKGLAYAADGVAVGDKVITAFGEGTVKMVVPFCTSQDDWVKLISSIYTVDKITHKIVEVK